MSKTNGGSIPVREVARYPLPGLAAPSEIHFSPDGSWITYLLSPDRTLRRQLFAYHVESGAGEAVVSAPGAAEGPLSREEELRRQRQRQMAQGVTSYQWARRAQRLLIPMRGGVYGLEGVDGELRQIVAPPEGAGGSPAIDPRLSPDGEQVAFVRDDELWVAPFAGGAARQITRGAGEDGVSHGLAEYIAQEEMDRQHGFWWAPDGERIAFAEVDERHIPLYRIVHQGRDEIGPGFEETHRYPFAGGRNAIVRLGVVPAAGGEPVWMDLGPDEDQYLARVRWLPDGALAAQVENRAQMALELIRLDPETGERTLLLRETSDVWINLHDMFRPLRDGRFIWASERSGSMHLTLHDAAGDLVRPLTAGDWMVTSLDGVDEERGLVFFTATREGPLERHLYAAPLAGGAVRRITVEPGTHAAVVDAGRGRFVDVHHSLTQPPRVRLCSLADGGCQAVLFDEVDPRVEALGLRPPELVTLESRDGTRLHGALYRPPAAAGAGLHPTAISVYGGPHAQRVTDSWATTARMREQFLASQGLLVFTLDNRGSAGRGLAFEGAIKERMGHLEVMDQVDGVRWLVAQGLADPERVGIYGWSYGGYMAAMCLAQAPETFRAAVAGAPVTHWDGYDTHYTERYMGTPMSNADGYEESSVMYHVSGMTGALLLVHGLIDENVHFRHTARLINRLIKERKEYHLLLFPDARHTPPDPAARVYMEEQICAFLRRELDAGGGGEDAG